MPSKVMTIHLNNVELYGYHGLYKEEQILGNTFILNLSVEFIPKVTKINEISDTIDYVEVYEIVKQRMQTPTALLETIVEEIASSILSKFPIAHKVTLEITKTKVFINTLNGNMSVRLIKTR
jgi:dihydroneopterin aldolase